MVSPIPEPFRQEILRRLEGIGPVENVRLLFAIESGSRAWGFASATSDYDVRFVYVRPRAWYLALDAGDKPDVLDYGTVDEIDLNGWDARKALRLYWQCNPSIMEWLHSDIVYREEGTFRRDLRELLPQFYRLDKSSHHYRSMTKANFRTHFQKEKELVPIKKYFYVLRPLLANRWLEQHRAFPPLEFHVLLTMLADRPDLLDVIAALLEKKRSEEEKSLGFPIPALNQFIEDELARWETRKVPDDPAPRDIEPLNELFRQLLD